MTIEIIPLYSDALVGLARSLDCAEVAVRAANWHFGDLEMDHPEMYARPDDVPGWARSTIGQFENTLPNLRGLFRTLVERESNGASIEANRLGDAVAPESVQKVMQPVLDDVCRHKSYFGVPATLLELTKEIAEYSGGRRVIVWDSEAYAIPHEMNDSFVEVWFRRAYGYWEDGGAYPVYLSKRAYGWQAFGFER